MKINMFTRISVSLLILAAGFATILTIFADTASAQIDMKKRPSLVITNDKMAGTGGSGSSVYSTPPAQRNVRAPSMTPMANEPAPMPITPSAARFDSRPSDVSPADISGSAYYQPTQTIVAKKVEELKSDLSSLQGRVSTLSSQLKGMKERNHAMAAEYNASIATINTQLQSGTTPGNPRLVQKLATAQDNLDRLSQSVADLNSMAVEAANAASMGSFLLEACRSAYGLSGAVEEDHTALANVEDQVNTTIVTIDRVLNEVNDDITRTAAYLSAERGNLRTLSLAVTNGDYYGRSLAGRPFSTAPPSGLQPGGMMQPASLSSGGALSSMTPMAPAPAPLTSPRPLVKIKFDQPNVDYEQAVYMAVNEAMQKYPSARFELIAVNPSAGNAAQVAIESTRARRNAEMVLRSLSQMGIDVNRIDLSTMQSADARSNEVHIFIR